MPAPKRLERQRWNRKWTIEQKKKILKEIDAARVKDEQEGRRGRIKEVLDKYNLTTAWIAMWKKQLAKLEQT